MQNQVKNELNALKSSVTFAMSLGAKELFHTNFIAFLLENDDPSLDNIRSNLANLLFNITPRIKFSSSTKFYTWREKYNLDLVIIAIDWKNPKINKEGHDIVEEIEKAYVCVIEAKLKSIPTLAQLKVYDDKLKNGLNFDLNSSDYLQMKNNGKITGFNLIYNNSNGTKCLTLLDKRKSGRNIIPVFFEKLLLSQVKLPVCTCISSICTCTPTACKWTQKHWDHIASAIKTGIHPRGSSNPGLDAIVSDYASHLENLAKLITQVRGYSLSKFKSGSSYTYKQLCDDINAPEFNRIRIHDLVGKVVFNDLEQRLVNVINPCQCNNLQFNHESFYTRQQPGIDFEWFYKGNANGKIFKIGVQIQGSDYRHYIATNTNWTGLNKLSVILSKNPNNWFFTNINGKTLAGKKNNNLYKFSADKFLYSKMTLNNEDFDQLSKNIKYSMDLACKIMTTLTSGNALGNASGNASGNALGNTLGNASGNELDDYLNSIV